MDSFYQTVTLADLALIGDPVPLPPEFANLSDAVVSDFSAHIDPPPVGYAGKGLFPLLVSPPAFDPETEANTGAVDLASRAVDAAAGVVRAVSGKRPLTPEEIAARAETVTAAVDVERDRRIAAGFPYQGTTFQSRPDDFTNLGGASTAAVAAVLNGAQPGDLRWADPTKDFAWIAADNGLVPLDAPGMIGLGSAAMAHRSRLIFAGSTIKARIRAGEAVGDVTADALWM